ncbi:MAG: diguanylate cyclase [Oscillospiraceae bacterium]|nr:diguanylate cyclase [Oscillospiraceae bacterium]
MKQNKDEKNVNNEQLEGYNPKVYRQMSIVLVLLTILNIVAVFSAFNRIGYGLWHAEDALSCIAQIDHEVLAVNDRVLEVVIHNSDDAMVNANIDDIRQSFKHISESAERFRGIDLSHIDSNLQADFDSVMTYVKTYQSALDDSLEAFEESDRDGSAVEGIYNDTVRAAKEAATVHTQEIFETQDKATYDFFVRCAQQFLFVILFLILTLVIGLIAIQGVKKKERNVALLLLDRKNKASAARQKAIDIAYVNILTGLKNRYALENELQERLPKEDITIAMFNFNSFSAINEQYGRQFGDEYISTIAKTLQEKYSAIAEIYCTQFDEFCFIFKDLSTRKAEETVYKIMDTMSRNTSVMSVMVQNTVSACIYHYNSDEKKDVNKVFKLLDKGISNAKKNSKQVGKSAVVTVEN